MKRVLTIVGLTCVLAACATMHTSDNVRSAALKTFGAEQIAWSAGAKAAGMDSVIEMKRMYATVDSVEVTSPNDATAVATYEYTGRFATPAGEKTGIVTVQRKLHFTKSGSDWTLTGAPLEIARSNSWGGGNEPLSTVR